MKTSRSEEFFERSKKVSPGGVHSPVRAFRGVGGVPRFIREAQGAELIDVDGNRYIDFCMSWGPLIFGHQDPEVAEAVRKALQKGWSYGAAEEGSLELAELITGAVPWVEKIRFVNSGTEAVMAALRVARAATGRTLILKFEGCYHGHVDSMLVKAGSGLAEAASPDSAGVSASTAAETLIAPLDDAAALRKIFSERGAEIAAVIIEPLPANNGILPQTEAFLRELSALASQHGALTIYDEVISGFRVAFGGMAERMGIRPDLVTYGKIIGGGFPVGAYGGKKDLMDLVAPLGPVYQAGTLSANPVAMAAGLAMLKKLQRGDPYLLLEEKNQRVTQALGKIAEEAGVPVSVQSSSSIFWSVFGARPGETIRKPSSIPSAQKERFPKVFHALLERGIYLAPSGYEVSFLSTAHEQKHLDRFLESFREVVKK